MLASCANIFAPKNYNAKKQLEKSCKKHFCTKKMHLKCLWNWLLIPFTELALTWNQKLRSYKAWSSAILYCIHCVLFPMIILSFLFWRIFLIECQIWTQLTQQKQHQTQIPEKMLFMAIFYHLGTNLKCYFF